jgi:predicted NAD-dependent protein-ADP-ribosyltransferase YbiA (DUF1768 family)
MPVAAPISGVETNLWLRSDWSSAAWAIVIGGAPHQFNYRTDLAQALVTMDEHDVANSGWFRKQEGGL